MATKIDVTKLSADEVFALLNELQPKAKELEAERKQAALAQIKEIIEANAITKLEVLNLFGATTTQQAAGTVYKHPTTGQTHVGKGRPTWIKQWLADGHKLEELIVKEETPAA
jgi:DNA-binding protein H-NS